MIIEPIVVDGSYETPVEVNGSPSLSTDEVTRSRLIVRRFVQLKAYYEPLPQASIDPVFTDAYLISEASDQVEGPIMFFTRTYAQKPESRVEPQRLAFTLPGRSQVEFSELSLLPVGWNAYGKAAPYTRDVVGTATISYEINPPVTPDVISTIKFEGAPVDFVGDVWRFVGNQPVTTPEGTIMEPRFQYAGTTFPPEIPLLWTVENSLQRWRGPIWERRIITVNTLILQFA